MCDGDFDGAELECMAWVRARKTHRCFACRETIRVGDRHHVTTQRFEGEWHRYRHCARCTAIIKALVEAGADSVRYDLNCDALWEDNFGPLPDDVAALAFITPDEAQERLVPKA